MKIQEDKAGKTKSSLCLHTEKLQTKKTKTKKNHEDKETDNYRETVAYFKRNNHFSLREDNKKVLKQVCEVQNSPANCSPT